MVLAIPLHCPSYHEWPHKHGSELGWQYALLRKGRAKPVETGTNLVESLRFHCLDLKPCLTTRKQYDLELAPIHKLYDPGYVIL